MSAQQGRKSAGCLFKIIWVLLGLASLFFLLWLLGPRVQFTNDQADPVIPGSELNPESLGPDQYAALDSFLAAQELLAEPLVPGTQSRITWQNPGNPARTEYVVVYLHGFSASPREAVPYPQHLARELQANLYIPRLSGHGSEDPEAMGRITVAHWLRDVRQTLTIARMLGNRLVLVGLSTGVPLALYGAELEPDLVEALVLMSPNFGPANPLARVPLWPWGMTITRLVTGDYYEWEPYNADHALYWTERYPVQAIAEMMLLVDWSWSRPLELFQTPLLTFHTLGDTVVRVPQMEAFVNRYGREADPPIIRETVIVPDSLDPNQHVIVGDIRSPNTTERVLDRTLAFLRDVRTIQSGRETLP